MTNTNTGSKQETKQHMSSASLKAPETANDKSQLPAELSTMLTPVDIKEVLKLAPTDVVEFSYGDYIPNAPAFNNYLEANVPPGKTLKMTKLAAIQLIKQLAMTLNSGGLNSLPMICLNDECPRVADCPLHVVGETPPTGYPCPIEKTEALNHVRHLSKDFGAGRSYADQLMIQGVAAVQMLKARVYSDLATNPEPIIEWEKGIDARGNIVKEKGENPNFRTLERLLKQEQTLLKGLHLTQEQRIKMEANTANTADVLIGSLKEKLQELKRKNNTSGLEIVDATLRKVDENRQETVHSEPGSELPGTCKEEATDSTEDNSNIPGGCSESPTGDITEGLKDMERTETDYRTAVGGSPRQDDKPYLGKSPFGGRSSKGDDTDSGPDADTLEEIT